MTRSKTHISSTWRDYSRSVGLKGVSLGGTKHRIWQQIGNDYSYGKKNVRINEEIQLVYF